MKAPLVLLRSDRASKWFEVGTPLWYGRDCYGCASDDTRVTGIEHIAVALNETGEPFFTVPREDVGSPSATEK